MRPIELFIDDRAHFDPALVERLEAVKQANGGEHKLTRMGTFAAPEARLSSTASPRTRR